MIACGYVIPALASRFGTTTAVNVSALIRGTYHLYQGIVVAPFHFSYGLFQAYVFVRFGKLWRSSSAMLCSILSRCCS